MEKETPQLVIPECVARLPRFPRDELFRKVCSEVSDRMLQEIAACDYGHDRDEHLAALRKIKAGENWDKPLEWVPHEVLALYRWSSYEERERNVSEVEFHKGRLFAASSLHAIGDIHENHRATSPDLLGPILGSCLFLKGEYLPMLRGEIVDELERTDPWDEHCPFLDIRVAGGLCTRPGF